MSKRRTKDGFTLVELLIAATMTSILFIGLGAHLRGGLTVWQRVTSQGERLQQERVALDRLERDLANAFVYDDRAASYGEDKGQLPAPVFEERALRFFTRSVEGRGAPVAVRLVTYRCDTVQGASGLWRTSESVGAARLRATQPVPALLLSPCGSFSIHYAYTAPASAGPPQLDWRAAWPDPPNQPFKLPRLVQVSLVVAGRRAERLVAVPVGALGQVQSGPTSS